MLKFYGVADNAALFLQNEQLKDAALWKKFVDIYRIKPDADNQGWRGEFWGKMMRGGVLVYEYTRDEELYRVLTDSVNDMMTVAEPDGRVSTYQKDAEFDSWDLWCRKYVILSCEYYLEICKDDELKQKILSFICGCADYILAHIGADKKRITSASRSWYGINSSSILEPIVRLYFLTNDRRYLDFASYIVEEGGAVGINIFELAYENKLYPYEYGVSKAYEMMSCFEGLLEYYRATGNQKYKTAVINFANAVMKSEVSIIGSCGITHELFDYTRARQTVSYDGVMQETCVTVTWMKLCSKLLELTGDSVFADEMEKSFYNAYLGALNTEHRESVYVHNKFADVSVVPSFMPFDSYSPLKCGKRGQKVGGNQLLHDNSYYGCCACIGAAGVGVFMKNAITVDENVITVNFFEKGEACVNIDGVDVALKIDTEYPVCGKVKISVKTSAPIEFVLKIRNPGWAESPNGYLCYEKVWHNDTVECEFDMTLKLHYPEKWDEAVVYTDTSKNTAGFHCATAVKVYHDEKDDRYVAVTRGPLTLCADSRTGKSADSEFDIRNIGEICENEIVSGVPCLVKLKLCGKDKKEFFLVDYASAGKDWQTDIAAWLPTK